MLVVIESFSLVLVLLSNAGSAIASSVVDWVFIDLVALFKSSAALSHSGVNDIKSFKQKRQYKLITKSVVIGTKNNAKIIYWLSPELVVDSGVSVFVLDNNSFCFCFSSHALIFLSYQLTCQAYRVWASACFQLHFGANLIFV